MQFSNALEFLCLQFFRLCHLQELEMLSVGHLLELLLELHISSLELYVFSLKLIQFDCNLSLLNLCSLNSRVLDFNLR